MPHEHSIGYEGRIDYGAIGTVTNLAFRAQSQSAITTSSDPKNDGHASPQIEARGVRQRMLHLREKVSPWGVATSTRSARSHRW